MWSVALIGAGRMGALHGANAARDRRLRLKYVVDHRGESAAALAGSLGARPADLATILADPEIAGVVVASSTDMHLEHCLAATAAGKAVFCEKPIDLDLDKARAAAPRLGDAPLLLGFNRRFDPDVAALKRALDAGAVGALETLHIVNHDPAAPPPGFIPTSGGLFRDFTIHDLDLARWLLGEEPVELYATASCLVDPEIGRLGDVDTARTLLRTASGRLCVISNTRRSGYGYDQRVEAYGAAGRVAIDNRRGDTVETATEEGALRSSILPDFPSRYAASYAAEMDHFADMLADGARPRAGFADGVAALALADACDRSHRTGRPVRLQS
ncbi:MAG TPA: inositol 2-dehydrogenase [Caulobacteraceae bacterium]|nr:inositol 2-dehydrogenase [Caulobacteraceae bacterium]